MNVCVAINSIFLCNYFDYSLLKRNSRKNAKATKQDEAEKQHRLLMEKQALESAVFVSNKQVNHLLSIIQQQEEFISRKGTLSALKISELSSMNSNLKKSLEEEKDRYKELLENFEKVNDTVDSLKSSLQMNKQSIHALNSTITEKDIENAQLANLLRDEKMNKQTLMVVNVPEVNVPSTMAIVSPVNTTQDHSYAALTLKPSKQFICAKCGIVVKRKYALQIHEKFHCKKREKCPKNSICPICSKSFTYDGLRSHFLGFINSEQNGRKPRDLHGKYSPEEHKRQLEKIKLMKKMEKM